MVGSVQKARWRILGFCLFAHTEPPRYCCRGSNQPQAHGTLERLEEDFAVARHAWGPMGFDATVHPQSV